MHGSVSGAAVPQGEVKEKVVMKKIKGEDITVTTPRQKMVGHMKKVLYVKMRFYWNKKATFGHISLAILRWGVPCEA
jgi:hypothetical protein